MFMFVFSPISVTVFSSDVICNDVILLYFGFKIIASTISDYVYQKTTWEKNLKDMLITNYHSSKVFNT
jgi:uncharacterized membrane protein